jgi:hypothetical protein
MLAALAAATTIHLETYILAGDATGERFKSVLVEQARAGTVGGLRRVGSFGSGRVRRSCARGAGRE